MIIIDSPMQDRQSFFLDPIFPEPKSPPWFPEQKFLRVLKALDKRIPHEALLHSNLTEKFSTKTAYA
jgi:hypothetical protein